MQISLPNRETPSRRDAAEATTSLTQGANGIDSVGSHLRPRFRATKLSLTELMIWDTGDGALDSSVLLDNVQWVGGGVVVPGTVRPPN